VSALARFDWSRYAMLTLKALVALTICFILAQAAYHNFNRFFNEHLVHSSTYVAFDGRATLAGERASDLGPEYRVLAAGLLQGPAIDFVFPAGDRTNDIQLDPTRDLPLGESRPTAIFLDETKGPYVEWLRALYPNAEVSETLLPGEQITALWEVLVPVEDIDGRRGLEGTYTGGDGTGGVVREADLEIDWSTTTPATLPFAATWTGVLKVNEYGSHDLVFEVPGTARLSLDGEVVAEGEGRVSISRDLFRGDHLLQIEAIIAERGVVSLTEAGAPVAPAAFFIEDEHARGVIGSFYTNLKGSGEPLLVQADPFVGFRYHSEINVPSPFTAVWRASLVAPETGLYPMQITGRDEAVVLIDGEEVLNTANRALTDVELTAGFHDLEVVLRNSSGSPEVYVYWTVPGREREVIPAENLIPR